MAKPMATVVHWGGDLSDDELSTLSSIVAHDLNAVTRQKIRSLYLSYLGGAAMQDAAQPTKALRQRLRALASSARDVAKMLGADDRYFEEVGAYYSSHRNSAPGGIVDETNSRVELELVHLDIAFRKAHGRDLGCSEIELMTFAWQGAQVSRAAENALAELTKERRGRPDSGARRFVITLIDALVASDVDVKCWYSPVEGGYGGTFPLIVRWFRALPQPIRESEQTLCKIAARELARRNKVQNGGAEDY